MSETEKFLKWLDSEEDNLLLVRLRASEAEVSDYQLAEELAEEWGEEWKDVDWLAVAERISKEFYIT